ncbi:MAG: class II fructose-bisphosphate aldolase [Candidatus Cloacimonetes bacterium]|nr:class II fructose-bisphosphate aldolase [Candidatus Cloacimonadota bacterium]MCF7813053.1 class II fructose-bisphosphate aldolase [Candidatus Cloacimonadota bacterium]MCF7867206.1 class II fructose-bisphosphate aldolase [Candidatus Cloacimonadota bacterium]MCF7882650.1 class II fructose-bisphosphate aldolase [Candidatus Cloacimonadota bacterium]
MFYTGDKLKQVFDKAKKERFGIIASNIVFDSQIRGIVQGYEAQKSDGLLQMSAGACKYAAGNTNDIKAGAQLISAMLKIIASQFKNSGVGLHIDHATPNYFDFVVYCIENDLVSSVMIDASKEEFEENIRISKEVVKVAHKHGVLVEGEIGYIKGTEDEIVSDTELYTQPGEALEYVQKTGVDLFAASVGTNHGVTKGSKVTLKLDLIKEIDDLLIKNNVETGIVLHGASGLTAKQQMDAIKNGVVKINKDTHYQMDFARETQAYWEKEKDAIAKPDGISEDDYMPDKKRFDPRKWIIHSENAMQASVEELVQISGSAGKSILI